MSSLCKSILLFCFFSNFSPIIVPLQSAMTVTLPFGAGNHPNHSPFPGLLPCIVGFEDTVILLNILLYCGIWTKGQIKACLLYLEVIHFFSDVHNRTKRTFLRGKRERIEGFSCNESDGDHVLAV